MADTRVEDVMTHLVVMLYPTDTIHDAARRLARNHISGAPVVEAGKVVGIVSESDLIHAVMPPVPADRGASVLDTLALIARPKLRRPHDGKTVADVMSSMVIQVSPDTSIWKAASIMERKGVKRLPVVDENDYLLGIVSRADLVKALARDDKQIRADLLESINVLGDDAVSELRVDVSEGVATLRGRVDRRSTHGLASKIAARTPGVVEVVDRLEHEFDDTRFKGVHSEVDPKDPRLDWQPAALVHRSPR